MLRKVAQIHHESRCALRHEAYGQTSLDRHVQVGHAECHEHGLLHALGFSEQDGIFSGAILSSSVITMAVVRLKASGDNTARTATIMADTLIASNMIGWKVLERRQDRSSNPHRICSHWRGEEFSHSKYLSSSLVKVSRRR